jgi:hypothetical protein
VEGFYNKVVQESKRNVGEAMSDMLRGGSRASGNDRPGRVEVPRSTRITLTASSMKGGRPLNTHCKHGHRMEGANFRIAKRRDGRTYQDCLICRKARNAAGAAIRKQQREADRAAGLVVDHRAELKPAAVVIRKYEPDPNDPAVILARKEREHRGSTCMVDYQEIAA